MIKEGNEVDQYRMRLEMALKIANICIFEVDIIRQRYTFFANSEDIFGKSSEQILSEIDSFSELEPEVYQKKITEYFSHPDDQSVIDRAFHSILQGIPTSYEARMKAGDSCFTWCRLDVTPIVEEGIPKRMIGVITNINHLKKKALRLEHAVRYDNFTGLYHKRVFIEEVDKKIKEDRNQCHALLILDIDDFKHINDSFGHLKGDEIILLIARELLQVFNKDDFIGRFGGDEFIVYIHEVKDQQVLIDKLDHLVNFGKKQEISWTNSVGIAIYPKDATTVDGLMSCADEALYEAKREKATFQFYEVKE